MPKWSQEKNQLQHSPKRGPGPNQSPGPSPYPLDWGQVRSDNNPHPSLIFLLQHNNTKFIKYCNLILYLTIIIEKKRGKKSLRRVRVPQNCVINHQTFPFSIQRPWFSLVSHPSTRRINTQQCSWLIFRAREEKEEHIITLKLHFTHRKIEI